MASCIKCGGSLGDFDVGGDMICDNCEARGSGGAGGAPDVPCQRCGMYLPSHELQMWNSRLYCAYCIMDVKDEEKRSKELRSARSDPLSPGAGKGGIIRKYGTCQRCGKSTDELYTSSGMSLCAGCYHAYGPPEAGGSKPSRFGQIVSYIRQKLRLITLKPKIIPTDPRPQKKDEQEFDIRGRRMRERGEQDNGDLPIREDAPHSPSEGKKGETQGGAQKSPGIAKETAEQSKANFTQFKGKTDPKK